MDTTQAINSFVGQTIKEIFGMKVGSDSCLITFESGDILRLYHSQNCCESVQIEDVSGEVQDLIGNPLLMAEESVGDTPADHKFEYEPESYTWTFYKFATVKGYVTLRWLGKSNGSYGEGVSVQVNDKSIW